MNKNMIARIAVALVAIPLILWICFNGGEWLVWGMIALFAFIALNEFLYQEKIYPIHFLFWFSHIFVLWCLDISRVIFTAPIFFTNSSWIVFLIVTGMIISIGKKNPKELFASYTRTFWGVTYIGVLYPFVLKVWFLTYHEVNQGIWLFFLFAILWVGDSMALFVGKSIGKHKLAPSVSPNKTVEGFIGGLLGAIVVGIIMFFWKFHDLVWYHVIFIAIGCSVFGQLGDLVESMWKRSLDIKDSSNLIPGHGGILDRFDSLLFAAPFMFLYVFQLI